MPSTTTCRLGDVVLLDVEFIDRRGSKRRPAIVVSNDDYNRSSRDAVIVPLSSSTAPLRLGDWRLNDWESAGLVRASVAKGRPLTTAQRRIERKLGRVSGADLEGVLSSLRAIFA